jgi:hypothetical protein
MLQILEFTQAHLVSVTARSEKHGDEDVPAVTLVLELTVANTLLDAIDPDIRTSLFKKLNDGQDGLEGFGDSTPVLKCNSIGKVSLETKYEGWTLEIDDGIDESVPLQFGGAKVDKFTVEPKQGGSCTLRMRIGTSDLDAECSGFLGMHVKQDIWIKLRAPERAAEPASSDDDGPSEPDATDLFLSTAGADQAEDRGEAGINPFPVALDASDAAPTHEEVFGAPKSDTVVTMKRRRLGKGLGSDADQAARQDEALAEDPTMRESAQ